MARPLGKEIVECTRSRRIELYIQFSRKLNFLQEVSTLFLIYLARARRYCVPCKEESPYSLSLRISKRIHVTFYTGQLIFSLVLRYTRFAKLLFPCIFSYPAFPTVYWFIRIFLWMHFCLLGRTHNVHAYIRLYSAHPRAFAHTCYLSTYLSAAVSSTLIFACLGTHSVTLNWPP